MAGVYQFSLVSSEGVFFQGKAICVVLPAIDGEQAIMAHHEEMIVAITNGTLRFESEDGTWQEVIVSKGLAFIANNRMQVLVENCFQPEEYEERKRKEQFEQQEEEARQKQSIKEYQVSQASLARTLNKMKEASKVASKNI